MHTDKHGLKNGSVANDSEMNPPEFVQVMSRPPWYPCESVFIRG